MYTYICVYIYTCYTYYMQYMYIYTWSHQHADGGKYVYICICVYIYIYVYIIYTICIYTCGRQHADGGSWSGGRCWRKRRSAVGGGISFGASRHAGNCWERVDPHVVYEFRGRCTPRASRYQVLSVFALLAQMYRC